LANRPVSIERVWVPTDIVRVCMWCLIRL
jgi:hypothetical protein